MALFGKKEEDADTKTSANGGEGGSADEMNLLASILAKTEQDASSPPSQTSQPAQPPTQPGPTPQATTPQTRAPPQATTPQTTTPPQPSGAPQQAALQQVPPQQRSQQRTRPAPPQPPASSRGSKGVQKENGKADSELVQQREELSAGGLLQPGVMSAPLPLVVLQSRQVRS